MKKTILKIGFITVCIGVIIFLLLPFLQTTPPASSSLKTGQARVFTSNPITSLLKRLAPLLGRKERAHHALTAQKDSVKHNLPSPDYTPVYAEGKNISQEDKWVQSPTNPQTVTVPTADVPFDYADASFQTDAGEWVLIRQTAPESSKPGMHEINVHDNPYDRYVRQERAKNFGPQTPKEEIPDSKWARLTRPIKTFFGLSDPQPVGPTHLPVYRESDSLSSLGSAQDKLADTNANRTPAYPYMRIPLPDITPAQWAKLSIPERERLQEQQAARDFAELLSGEQMAQQIARFEANAKFPVVKNEQEQQAKEEYVKRLTEEHKARIRDGIRARIEENAADKEPVDELAHMLGCHDSSLPQREDSCQPNVTPQHEQASVLAAAQEKNAQDFYNATRYVLPKGIPFTVILGPTDPQNFEEMKANPQTAPTAKLYDFLYQQRQCDKHTCYWVPSKKQSDPKLEDSFVTVGGAKLETDPFKTDAADEEAFVQSVVNQLGEEATPEQRKEAEKKAREQWEKYRPNWTSVVEDQLVKLTQNNRETLAAPLDKPSDKKPIFPLVPDPAIAPDIANLIGPTSFVYNQTSLVNSSSPVEAGKQFTESLAKGVNDVKAEVQEIQRGAVKNTIQPLLNRIFTQTNNNGTGFDGALQTIKALGGPNNKQRSGKK